MPSTPCRRSRSRNCGWRVKNSTANIVCGCANNGHGVDAEARKHLFEPFFTTKPGEQGLGLGLTLSASLAAATGGHLGVEHPASGGTTFVLSLPLVSPTPAEPI